MLSDFVFQIGLAAMATSCVAMAESSGGDTETVHVVSTETFFCKGAADCPSDPDCAIFWCQQIQTTDEDYGKAWGRCNLAPLAGGALCDHGAGICLDKKCEPLDRHSGPED